MPRSCPAPTRPPKRWYGDDGVVLGDLVCVGVVDEDVAVAEEVARGVVEELASRRSSRCARNCGIGEARAEGELLVGHRERAAEGDAGAGEVGLGDASAAVGGERLARVPFGRRRPRAPSQTSLTTIVLRSTTSTTRTT